MIQVFGSTIASGQSYTGVARTAMELRMSGCIDHLRAHYPDVDDYGDFSKTHFHFFLQLLNSIESDKKQLILGGDHSQSIATVPAILALRPETGIIWIDAHGDINTPKTSPTGALHGMPLAALLGRFASHDQVNLSFANHTLKPDQITLIGVRDLDPGEIEIIDELKIKTWTRQDVREQGMREILNQTLYSFEKSNYHNIHVSFDVDAIDPELAPATGVCVEDGLNLSEIQTLASVLRDSKRVQSLEIVEINPDLSPNPADWEVMVQIINLLITQVLTDSSLSTGALKIPTLRELGQMYLEKSF